MSLRHNFLLASLVIATTSLVACSEDDAASSPAPDAGVDTAVTESGADAVNDTDVIDTAAMDASEIDAADSVSIAVDATDAETETDTGPSCTDGTKNGSESDIDCGGSCANKCALDKKCNAASDCESGWCGGGQCNRPVLAVSANLFHSCAVLGDLRVKCWGLNSAGQLGLGDTNNRGDQAMEMGASLPYVDLGTTHTATSVVPGYDATCAIFDNDRIKCWGSNQYGQLGQADTTARGDNPGELGDGLPFIDLGTGRTVKKLALGNSHACAILDNDSVKCWGLNDFGQLGLGDTNNRGDATGEMGDALAAVNLGTVSKPVDLALGTQFSCALFANGKVKCWGHGAFGRLGTEDTNHRGDGPSEMGDTLPFVNVGTGRTVVQLAVRTANVWVLLDDGTVRGWGSNVYGQLGTGDTVAHGDVTGTMGDALVAVPLGTGRTVAKLAGAGNRACVLFTDGAVKCWGSNSYGDLGLGDKASRGDQSTELGDALPAIDLGTGRKVATRIPGGTFTCAILDNQALKCWGQSNFGQIGLGDTNHRGDAPGEMGDALSAVSLF